MSVKRKLDSMAESLIDEAMADIQVGEEEEATFEKRMPIKERVDIFKAASAWYLGNRKASKGEPDETDEGGTFAELQQRINGKAATQ